MADLLEIRKEIDRTDREIVSCYEKRMALVEEVAKSKIASGKEVYDPEREQQKIDQVTGMLSGDFDKEAIREIFTELMTISRRKQIAMMPEPGEDISYESTEDLFSGSPRVCYQGLPGSYSHLAAQKIFGEGRDFSSVPSFRDVCEKVADGETDFGILPIENSSAGMVSDVYDLLDEYENVIAAQVELPVNHALLGVNGAKLSDIRTVYSHPQGLMQCSSFLASHPEWETISERNTAVAAQKVREEKDVRKAAIASKESAKLYGLSILLAPVNDSPFNTTRFIVIRKDAIYSRNADKVSLLFETRNESGSLYHLLSHFIFNHLNMTKIESRPIPDKPWEYRFYVDVEGNLADPSMRNALSGISKEALRMRILGSYQNPCSSES